MPDVEPDTSGYKPIFGIEQSKDGNKKPIPKWVPVTLLAISTAAMVVPIVLLRRHRAVTLGKTLAATPPPPRRTTSSRGIPIVNPTSNPSLFSVRDSALPSSSSASSSSTVTRAGDNFNGPLYCAKAFSIATFAVGAGAFVSIWGVRQYMGVETVRVQLRAPNAISQGLSRTDARICG
ncbi:hypothetical protein C8Q80DRAFT_1129792 [Daedaleopsis nitida]|nr:hypothetical protein C8Q80DRAFT_1129792 [Daedaleopsis nitida]